jgi:predicted nucleic-acid-binding protein
LRACIDTNILVRITVEDNPGETGMALRLLKDAEQILISTITLCEYVWVLKRTYKFSRLEIIEALKAIASTYSVITDVAAFDAGLQMLASGADFADGVIAYETRRMGADTFCSFDKKAVKLIKSTGLMETRIPG